MLPKVPRRFVGVETQAKRDSLGESIAVTLHRAVEQEKSRMEIKLQRAANPRIISTPYPPTRTSVTELSCRVART
jgi:hypothetical protein